VVQVHKEVLVIDESAGDEGVRKVVDRHSKIINVYSFIYIKLLFFNLFLCSLCLAESPNVKFSIV